MGEETYPGQFPNFLSKDGKLYSFESSSFVDHPPMMLNDGRVVSFDKISSVCFAEGNHRKIFMPNNNVSFNSIDDLQHFHTSEDAFNPTVPSMPSLTEGKMMDSAKFIVDPAKRDAHDAFGMPMVAQDNYCGLHIVCFIR